MSTSPAPALPETLARALPDELHVEEQASSFRLKVGTALGGENPADLPSVAKANVNDLRTGPAAGAKQEVVPGEWRSEGYVAKAL